MAVKSSELRSGVFVIMAIVALTILIFSVGNFRARLQPAVLYTTYVSDAKFMKTHDPVTFGGYRVGEIKNIEVAPDRHGQLKISLSVDTDLPVKSDSVVTVKQDGILGPKYLEISPGTTGSKRAETGAILQGIVPTAFVELGPAFEGPLLRLDKLLENLNAILGSEQFRKDIAGLLTESRVLLATLNEQVTKLGDVVGKAGEKSTQVLAELHETVKAAREPLTKTLQDADVLTLHLTKDADVLTDKIAKTLDELTARLSKSADGIDQLLRDSDGLIVQNNKNLYETLRGLRDTMHHLELAAKRIRANPSILIFGAEETPEQLKRTDETELRLKGRARRYDKEESK
ncbi:MAG TPA: MlaD family protein [Planctomycetota bacterium]|nr:MlaD family protein [Planctomycetota bacterium]